ncbi:MAG: UDP-glucose/GDP-mannose dehydrogenase family protein [Deltaproteobacteria bacterium]|nr:UDP-glucose/GDP-mannose dehydrogenase family protein [Deltaproteobacteria bacterium]MBW2139773.1 UDP-glucose/GDP-mannose dehydrogenase family protein [Deltaproteobacteria bacterium]
MNICVIGSGYVGLVTGTCFAEFGLNVVCMDKDEDRITQLNEGNIPIYEPGLEELLKRSLREGRLTFTTDLKAGIQQSLVIFIAVGTPSNAEGDVDLEAIKEVAASIGQNMNDYKVIVTKSTVPVGTGQMVENIIKENQSEAHSFDLISNPEFLREGSAIEDFMRPNRVVLGSRSEQALAIVKDLYRPLYLLETPFVITNIETAELIKYASNAFLATKISFINEIANLCELVDGDVHQVARAMGLDNRIGPKFLHPGPGFGGSCFPKDTHGFAHLARSKGYNLKIVDAVIAVNKNQRERMVDKIEEAAGNLVGCDIAFLGLTFKPNTDDIREAPAIFIIQKLIEKGAKVKAFDPAGMPSARQVIPEVEYADDAYGAVQGCDLLVIATEWNQFRNLDWGRIQKLLNKRVVVDLRNIYDPSRMRELGFAYTSVGR